MTYVPGELRLKQANGGSGNHSWAALPLLSLDFQLPPELEAGEPPEARGLARDEVRLLVSCLSDNRLVHSRFRSLPDFLQAGDVLVINTSGTMNAALEGRRGDGTPLELHLSTRLPAGLWVVELRQPDGVASKPYFGGVAGERLQLAAGGVATLHVPYSNSQQSTANSQQSTVNSQRPTVNGERGTENSQRPVGGVRLWIATLELPMPLAEFLGRYGFPIRYSYVRQSWPISYYQTVFATELGSAEMPSAGRAFTPELVTQLVARGVQFAPLLLHTGVASLEEHEPPYEEFYRVPAATARIVNAARANGDRVIAVGTTAVRALETVTGERGISHPGEGWTDLVIRAQRGLRAVDGLLTGLHESCASHLAMLEALAGREHLEVAYSAALQEGYLWHEFGDLHLILPVG